MENSQLVFFKLAKRKLDEAERGKFSFEETEHYLLGVADGIYFYERNLQKNDLIRRINQEFANLYKGTPKEREQAEQFFKNGPTNEFSV